jgi:hypothetical protein
LIAFLPQIEVSFEPAFAFPGERFAVVTSVPANVSAKDVVFAKSGNKWIGKAPSKPCEVWATIGEEGAYTDASMRVLPIAASNPIGRIGSIELVPMQGGAYGAILGKQRFPSLVSFTLAPRSAPMRERLFAIDYVYVGGGHATLSGEAGGLVRAVANIYPSRIEVTCLSLFDLKGTVNIAGQQFSIDAKPGERTTFKKAIPSFAP